MNRTKQVSLAIVSAFLSLALAACHDPIAGHQSPILLAPQVEFTSDGLANDTAVQPPVIHRIPGTGQLVVSVQVENRTNSSMTLEYQSEFLAGGAQKEPWTGWMPLRIPPRTDGTIQITSFAAEVDDFRIRIRRGQFN